MAKLNGWSSDPKKSDGLNLNLKLWGLFSSGFADQILEQLVDELLGKNTFVGPKLPVFGGGGVVLMESAPTEVLSLGDMVDSPASPVDDEFLGLMEDAVYDGLKTLKLPVPPDLFESVIESVNPAKHFAIPGYEVIVYSGPVDSSGFAQYPKWGPQAVVEKFDLLEAWRTKGKHLSAAHRKAISDALKARAAAKGKVEPPKDLKGTAALKYAFPVGHKVKTPHGEFEVVGHNTTHVVVKGAPQKMYPGHALKAVPKATHPSSTGASLAPAAPKPAGELKGTAALKAAFPTGSVVKTPHGDFQVIGHNATHVVVAGAPQKMYPAGKLQALSTNPATKVVTPVVPAPHLAAGDSTAHLQTVKALGGSTGAKLVKDPSTGELLVLKKGTSEGHIHAEYGANKVYEAMGVGVPAAKLADGGKTQLTAYHEGRPLVELKGAELEAARKKIGEHFVLDAVLANRDVVGPDNMNVMLGKDGVVRRIDVGASFDYRAQGGKKEFTGDVVELKSLRDPAVNPTAAAVYAHLSDVDVRAQALALHANRDALLAATPEQYRNTVGARLDDVLKKTGGIPGTTGQPVQMPSITAPAPAVGGVPPHLADLPNGHPMKGLKVGDPANLSGPGSANMTPGLKVGDKVGVDVNGAALHVGDKVTNYGESAIVTGTNGLKPKGLYHDDVLTGDAQHTILSGAALVQSVHGPAQPAPTATKASAPVATPTSSKHTLTSGEALMTGLGPVSVGDSIHQGGETHTVLSVDQGMGTVKVKTPYGNEMTVHAADISPQAGASVTKTGAIPATSASAPTHPQGQVQSANPVKVLGGKAEIAAAHPVGSKITLKDGTELTVTGHYTGYVYASGGKSKMYSMKNLAAQGATYGAGSPLASHVPAAPAASPAAVPIVKSKWQGQATGKTLYYGDPALKPATEASATAFSKHPSVNNYGSVAVTDASASPPKNGNIGVFHKMVTGQGWEYAGKGPDNKHVYGHQELGSMTVTTGGTVTLVPSKHPTVSVHGQAVVGVDGAQLKTKDGVPLHVGDTVKNGYGASYKVVGQGPNGQVLVSPAQFYGKKPPVYTNPPTWVTSTATSAAAAVVAKAVSVQTHVADKAPGTPPVGIPHAYHGDPVKAAAAAGGPSKDPIGDAHKAVPPAQGNTAAGSTAKYDSSHLPHVGQAVYDPKVGKNGVVQSIDKTSSPPVVHYTDEHGKAGKHTLELTAASGDKSLKPYDPGKASGGYYSSLYGPGQSQKHPFTPQEGWPTAWVHGETTLKNPAWVAEQHAHVAALPAAEKAAVAKYTGNTTYGKINGHLRHDQPASAAIKADIAKIDAAMDKSRTDHDFIVYRGIGNDKITGQPVAMTVGQPFMDKGYMSTSVSKGSEFGHATQMEILLPKGTRGIYTKAASHYPSENEFLLGRGTTFIVHEIVYVNGIRHVRLEAVPSEAPGASAYLLEAIKSATSAVFSKVA